MESFSCLELREALKGATYLFLSQAHLGFNAIFGFLKRAAFELGGRGGLIVELAISDIFHGTRFADDRQPAKLFRLAHLLRLNNFRFSLMIEGFSKIIEIS